ncbi:hypothetical protein RQP46_001912 [Phenoliferia psychrophenolica]
MDRREDGSTLPNEIIQLIIRAALPPLAFGSFPERSSALLPLTVVNRAWGTLSQTELYRHVHLENPSRASRFSASTRESPHLALKTVSLHLGSVSVQVRGTQRVWEMLEVLKSMRKVRVIWVAGLQPISLFGLAMAQDLRELYLYDVQIMEPIPLPPHPYPSATLPECLLRNLRHLTLHTSNLSLVDVSSADAGISPISPSDIFPLLFPPLSSLFIFDSHSYLLDLSLRAIDLSSSAAASCDTLTIDNRHPPPQGIPSFIKDYTLHWVALLPHYTALTRLAVAEAADLVPLVEALHPAVRLTTLRVVALQQSCESSQSSDEHVLALFMRGLPALRNLRRLVLPDVCRCNEVAEPDGMDLDEAIISPSSRSEGHHFELRRKVREVCEEREVVLVENEWGVDIGVSEGRVHQEEWESADSRW